VKRGSDDLTSSLQAIINLGAIGGLTDELLLEQFAARGDDGAELAFEVLLRRHGSMVLRVCRGVLGNSSDADDAFQATFLTLIRKPQSIRKHASLASWLYGVARRVALKAKRAATRRRQHEGRRAEMTSDSVSEREYDDRETILLEEVSRLPEKYRAPIVLCYLEGITHEAAARQLGWPMGTVQGRLARARKLLRMRLDRRGLSLPAVLTAAAIVPEPTSAAVSHSLLRGTVRLMASRAPVGAAVVLARAVGQGSLIGRFAKGAAALTAILVAGAGLMGLVHQMPRDVAGLRRSSTAGTPVSTVARPPVTELDNLLPAGAVARLGPTRFWHGRQTQQVAFSTDGRTLASVGDDDLARFWDTATGRERSQLRGRDSRIRRVMPALEGQALVWEERGTIRLVDWKTMRDLREFKIAASTTLLALSANGQVLAAAGSAGPAITLWDVREGRLLHQLEGHSTITTSLALSSDGLLLVSSGKDSPESNRSGRLTNDGVGSLRVWDVAAGACRRSIVLEKTWADSIAFPPDGKALAAAMTDGSIRLWPALLDREPRHLKSAGCEVGCFAFAPDGTTLAWSDALLAEPRSQASSIHLIEVASGRELRKSEIGEVGAYSLVFSPNGRNLASSGENVIRLWDPATGKEIGANIGDRNRIAGIAVTSDPGTVITGGHDGIIRFWDLRTGEEKRRIEQTAEPLRFLSLSADGKTLATGGEFHPSRLWDVATGKELGRFEIAGKRYAEWFGDLSPDGKTLATAAEGNEVIFWDAATGEKVTGEPIDDTIAGDASLPFSARKKSANKKASPWISPPRINALRFSPNGRSVASISGDWVRVWDAATYRETRRFKLPNAANSPIDVMNMIGAQIALSPDSKTIAASSQRDGTIFLLDASSGEEIARLDGSEDTIKVLAFSPDGRILATQFSSKGVQRESTPMIRLWDVIGRREICRFKAHRGAVTALTFTADGSRLLSASDDSTLLVWDVAALTGREETGPSRGHTVNDGY
jgi:RNA polymerase sigma factor (sigma-70 family)